MAMKKITAVLFAVVSILAAAAGSVDSATPNQTPPPAVDCGSIILNLADCLSFVANGSAVTKPEGSCCSGLKTVLKTDSQCLCEGFKNSAKLGVTLNITKAMALPSACHVSTPPLSNCLGSSVAPSTAPAISPSVALPPSVVSGAPTSAAGLSDSTPAPAPASVGSSSVLVVSTGSFALAVVVSALSFF